MEQWELSKVYQVTITVTRPLATTQAFHCNPHPSEVPLGISFRPNFHDSSFTLSDIRKPIHIQVRKTGDGPEMLRSPKVYRMEGVALGWVSFGKGKGRAGGG
jgi:hypothetical protein